MFYFTHNLYPKSNEGQAMFYHILWCFAKDLQYFDYITITIN